MREFPARVAIISRSQVVREGLVGIIGQLGEQTIVVDIASADGRELDADLTIYDLGGVHDLTAHAELQDLLSQGLPVIGLVFDDLPNQGQRLKSTQQLRLINLQITPKELDDLIAEMVPVRSSDDARAPRLPEGLTEREFRVLTGVAQGLSNKEISEQLFVSDNTVKTYIRSAYRRIGAKNRGDAIMWALEHGLVARPEHDAE